jgi:hypothetical protein
LKYSVRTAHGASRPGSLRPMVKQCYRRRRRNSAHPWDLARKIAQIPDGCEYLGGHFCGDGHERLKRSACARAD